jgi:hypothetical protein
VSELFFLRVSYIKLALEPDIMVNRLVNLLREISVSNLHMLTEVSKIFLGFPQPILTSFEVTLQITTGPLLSIPKTARLFI